MPLELEAKIKVPDHTPIRTRLRELAATPHGTTFELNTFFDTTDQKLLSADRGLRIRHQRHLTTNIEQSILTLKGPASTGQLKSREELELTISDPTQLGAILAALGYHPVLSFEKRRESWSLNGCKIELDELPHLGLFIEIEGPTESAILDLRTQLGLSSNALVHQSYSAQTAQYLRQNPERRMAFAAEAK